MLFNQVTKDHILQAIKDFEEKGYPNEFGPSSTYDVFYNNKTYPPKAIMAYANFHAEGRKIERYFKGGKGTDCFNAFERNGFTIVKKEKGMITYKDYEKQVYNWLNNKNKQDENFTFSLRQNGSKGAELDYFIGTEKSRYFAVTFWTLPVNFPGSSSDCIGLIFEISSDYSKFSYDFKLSQTNSPHNTQNKSALNLIKSAFEFVAESIGVKRVSGVDNKMYTIRTKPKQESYTDIAVMLKDVDRDLSKLIPIINNQIEVEKKVNPTFDAHRISKEEFSNMKEKLKKRFDKYRPNNQSEIIKVQYSNWLKGNESSDKINYYLRAIDILNELLNKDIYSEKNIATLTLLYQDLIENQKNKKTKYYYSADPSYGSKGLYSDSIKAFIEFIKEGHGITVKKDSFQKINSTATNQILYGPPGTGKTYYLKAQLFDNYTLKENAVTKEKYFEETVTKLTWWQVVALALVEIGTARVNDILENRWVAKKAALSESKNVRATLWGTLQMHTIEESENVAYKQRQNPLIFDKNKNKTWQLLSDEVKEQSPEILDILKDVNDFNISPQKEIKNYDFVTFHQSFAYEDFIEGIKPISPEEGEETTNLGYRIENGVFKELCIRAKNDPDNRYAIFIDEINRGNVSAIFGELITLIEVDKRKGAKNELSIKLPYSKKEFSVPSNLDIYGTMNTADRSVEALDTALRRRFEFKEMMPDYSVIENEYVEDVELSGILEAINLRIELLIDRDHTIGHSYFVNVDSTKKLANAFNNKIVPLLQEYFYGDYGKIGLVLGKGFIEKIKNDKVDFASFDYENANDFKIPSYKLNLVNADTIMDAVSELLGKKEILEN
ncbi:AAA domain-containing protein [Lacinutrix sp. WUR7]|uniref:McrB family protein n=1 Tax=Lacinutrix sp. WUR7 TaxID=2653681 RepID=UPI00193DB1FE|nr:AAA family ATPase [Lacinutrix sp. WUR7]QRM90778.1 AAA domain-containing protein [Lacinutrix sp. WUR7]